MKFVYALLALSGCVISPNYDSALDSYLGRSSALLFERWGQPTQAFQASTTTFVVSYQQRAIRSYPGAPASFDPPGQIFLRTNERNDGLGQTKPGSSFAWCDTVFTIVDGIVTHWSYEGNSCG